MPKPKEQPATPPVTTAKPDADPRDSAPVPTRAEGDKLTIYTDPLTCQQAEEEGTLVKFITSDGVLERWQVKFPTSPGAFHRSALAKGVKPMPMPAPAIQNPKSGI